MFGEADSRFGCLPLSSNGYFLGFFRECAEDADVPVADDDLLLRCPRVAFFPLADFNAFNKLLSIGFVMIFLPQLRFFMLILIRLFEGRNAAKRFHFLRTILAQPA